MFLSGYLPDVHTLVFVVINYNQIETKCDSKFTDIRNRAEVQNSAQKKALENAFNEHDAVAKVNAVADAYEKILLDMLANANVYANNNNKAVNNENYFNENSDNDVNIFARSGIDDYSTATAHAAIIKVNSNGKDL